MKRVLHLSALLLAIRRRLLHLNKEMMDKVKNNSIPRPTKMTIDVKTESILISELGYLSNAASQIRNDITSTFYLYLVMATIVSAGVGVLVGLYFNLRPTHPFSTHTIEVLVGLILVAGSLLSWYFMQRIIQLSKEYNNHEERLNAIKKFYVEQLEPTVPKSTALEITNLLYIQIRKKPLIEVPTYIRSTIFLSGSFSFGGASFIGFGLISFILAALFPSLYSTPNFWAYTVAILTSLDVLAICFLRFRDFFFSVNNSFKMKVIRTTLLFLAYIVMCIVLSYISFHLYPLLTSRDGKAFTIAVPLLPLFFVLCLLRYWQLYRKLLMRLERK
jgi:hypothetical protein